MAFAEDIVKGKTAMDECTVIMRQLFHEFVEKGYDHTVFDKLTLQKEKSETDKTEG